MDKKRRAEYITVQKKAVLPRSCKHNSGHYKRMTVASFDLQWDFKQMLFTQRVVYACGARYGDERRVEQG